MKKESRTKQGEVGHKKPPVNRQFGQPNGNPRNNGAWKKENTARYKLEKMLQFTENELKLLANSRDEPLFERKLAACIIKSDWKVIESMMSQVYGQPKQSVETTIKEPPKPLEDLTKGK